MFEVKNSIDWNTAKSYFNDKDNESEIFYDRKDYSRFLVFTPDDGINPIALDSLFGGDWRHLWPHDYIMLEKHYEDLNQTDMYTSDESASNIEELKLRYIPATISFEALGDTEVNVRRLTNHSYQSDPNSVTFTNWDHPTIKGDDAIVRLFPERLRMFLSEFSDLLNVKNKAYGNSALEPINVFSKASSSDVILQQIDHKLSRLKTSDTPSKNDVIDLMGYLTLYCLDQSWLDLQDLHK